MNVLDSIARQVRAYPQRPALILGANTLTYRQLWQNAARAASHLQAQGVAQGDCVAVAKMNPQAYLVIVMALARLGAVSTLVQPGWNAGKRAQVFLRNGVSAWVQGDDAGPAQAQQGVPGLRAITAQSLFAPLPQDAVVPKLAQGLEDRPWRIGLSSGTTGEGKSIPWTHGQVARLHRVSLDVYAAGPGERLLVFADLGIGLGMGHAMMQLAGGGAVILSDSIQPGAFFEAASQHRATQALTTTAIAFTLLEHASAVGAPRLPALRSLLLGGATVPPALRQGLQDKVCPNLQVTYGSTETGTLARSDHHSHLARPESAGRVMPWITAQAVDDSDRPLPPGEAGRLRFRSAAMASSYLGNPDATAQVFRDGWYYPGDVGALDDEGYLVLGGRNDDLINLQGVKVNPAQVEDAMASHPQVIEAAAVEVLQRNGRKALAAAVVARFAFETRELRAHVRERLGRLATPSLVLFVESLPKNEAGKLMRGELQARIEKAIGDSGPDDSAHAN
ncbi:class I adenylate-forming enzyme family protein [Caenimonas aquaedulcis]|uniref:Long-chain-fatty-acid--CoA ligase n=1 Tax=Caenimonas aquaedulcis TaxID=2793270 RepID=A0A931H4K6_9BURK|nr:AMP-binding protein [Caenimonas aquaedulcis]MBG9388392.1 AMP-binding protein [Caenimonas aquaedulcis]